MTDEEQIAAAIEQFLRAYNAGDIGVIAGYYADDLIKYRQGAPRRFLEIWHKRDGRWLVTRTMDNAGEPR